MPPHTCRGLGGSLQGHREYLQRRLEAIGFRVLPGQVGNLILPSFPAPDAGQPNSTPGRCRA